MKIKNIFSLALLFATPAFCLNNVTTAPKAIAKSDVKVGYFNSAEAVSGSKIGKDVFADMEKKQQAAATELKRDEEAYTKKVKDFQTKSATMSPAARQKAEEDLMKSKRNLENKAKDKEEDLRMSMNQAQANIGKYLMDAVTKCAKAEGYDVMVDVITGQTYVINSNKATSTQSIISSLDVAYSKDQASTAKTKAA